MTLTTPEVSLHPRTDLMVYHKDQFLMLDQAMENTNLRTFHIQKDLDLTHIGPTGQMTHTDLVTHIGQAGRNTETDLMIRIDLNQTRIGRNDQLIRMGQAIHTDPLTHIDHKTTHTQNQNQKSTTFYNSTLIDQKNQHTIT